MTYKRGQDIPFFSVLVPVYNQEKYIADCIDSVLNQTFNNYEIVLVDDGSTDSSGEICEDYLKRFPNIIKLIHKKNEGLLLARKTGIEHASGKYYLFLDSDDCFKEETLETIYLELQKNKAKIIIFNASYDKSFSKPINQYPFLNQPFISSNRKKEFLINFCGNHIFNNMCFKSISRDLVDVYDYDEGDGVWYGEDLFQSIPLVDRSDSFCIIQRPLYYYRQHDESMTHYYKPTQFESIKIVCKRLVKYAEKWEREYKFDFKDKAFEYCANECYRTAKNIIKSDDSFKKKLYYLSELKKDDFYANYIGKLNTCNNLSGYEQFVFFILESNSKILMWLLSNLFTIYKFLKKVI